VGLSDPLPALRCEGCAYDLTATANDGACPECGRLVVDSKPESRAALPWQERRTMRAWASSGWRTVRHQSRVAKELRSESRSSQLLLALNFMVAGAVHLGPALLALSGAFRPFAFRAAPNTTTLLMDNTALLGLAVSTVVPTVFYPAVWMLIRFWYSRRVPPIRPATVWTSVAYSSYAFVAGAVAVALLRFLWLALAPQGVLPSGSSPSAIALRILFELPTLAFFGGLAYAGYIDWRIMRANRFANTWTPADSAKEPA